MVGVPRSTGCSTCVKRRIKCDEGEPQCKNCLKYGQPCPGYDRGLKFIVGKPHREKRKPKPKPTVSADSCRGGDPSLSDLTTSSRSTPLDWSDSDYVGAIYNSRNASETPELAREHGVGLANGQLLVAILSGIPPIVKPQKQYQTQLVSSLCDTLVPLTRQNEIKMVNGYLMQLPGEIGKSKALDAAATAFAAQQIGTFYGDQHMLSQGRHAYILALSQLQHALNNPGEAMRSETHASAYLLCNYELFVGTSGYTSWMKHAEGLARLVKHCRPHRFRNQFDIGILRASRGLIIMDCMFTGKKVFLTNPEWRAVTRSQKPAYVSQDFHDFFEQFIELMAELPELLAKAWDLREAVRLGKPNPLSEDESLELVWQATELYGKFQDWSVQMPKFCPPPTECPSPRHDPIFPSMYEFETFTSGGIHLNYWACLIIIQMILQTCGCLSDPKTRNTELANMICKSVEWNSRGIWGGWRLGFPLHVAFEAAEPAAKKWIAEWHVKLSRTYAATSVEGLPQDPIKEEVMRTSPPPTAPIM